MESMDIIVYLTSKCEFIAQEDTVLSYYEVIKNI